MVSLLWRPKTSSLLSTNASNATGYGLINKAPHAAYLKAKQATLHTVSRNTNNSPFYGFGKRSLTG